VIVTTTTKIWPPSDMPIVLAHNSERMASEARRALESGGPVAVGREISSEGKLIGLSIREVCTLRDAVCPDVLLCEADGAAGRPLKVHGPGEPVIPVDSTMVLVIAGVDALGKLPGPDVIHRFSQYSERYGPSMDIPISPVRMAEILVQAAGYVPEHVDVVFVLNKADEDRAAERARAVVSALQSRLPEAHAAITSSTGRPATPGLRGGGVVKDGTE
jgi:probable selenium-dependent hydroxylase accessory protein YqeC